MKELEDYDFFPTWLRNFQTEFIGFVVAQFQIYKQFIRYLQSLSLEARPMYDLCSGSGEPAIHIYKQTDIFTQLILTDKYPNNLATPNDTITYLPESLDVLNMEWTANQYYTMFNAFHHFEDADKLTLIQKMLDSGSRGFFVEILEPTILCFFKVLLATTLGTLFLTPFVKPFSWKRLFFTYIIPINVLTITYDGIVSVLKSRSRKGYQQLFSQFGDKVKVNKLSNVFVSLIVIDMQAK